MTQARVRFARRFRRARRARRAMYRRALVNVMTIALAVAGLVLVAVVPPASAAPELFTWTGGADGGNQWSNPQNWDSHGVPHGSASVYISGGSGTMTYDLNPATVTISDLTFSGTWNVQGAQIPVGSQVFVYQGSSIDFQGGLVGTGSRLDLDVGSLASYGATVHVSGPLDVPNLLRVSGWDKDVSTIYLDGSAANLADTINVTRSTLVLDKPAGVAAARRVDAVGGAIKWNNDRQLQDQVTSPVAPELSQPMIRAELGGQIDLGGHEEVVNKVVIASGSTIDLGGGRLTAESVRTNGAYGGRSDITNGTFRFSASPQYDSADTVQFVDGTDPIDLHLDAKVLGSAPLVVDGSDDQIPLLRLGDADEYAGALRVRFGTVCAAVGIGGTVTENGGVYIDERNEHLRGAVAHHPPQPTARLLGPAQRRDGGPVVDRAREPRLSATAGLSHQPGGRVERGGTGRHPRSRGHVVERLRAGERHRVHVHDHRLLRRRRERLGQSHHHAERRSDTARPADPHRDGRRRIGAAASGRRPTPLGASRSSATPSTATPIPAQTGAASRSTTDPSAPTSTPGWTTGRPTTTSLLPGPARRRACPASRCRSPRAPKPVRSRSR